MGVYKEEGGFVLTLNPGGTFVGQITIDDATLRKVVEALGIPQRIPDGTVEKRVPEIRSIYVYRGK